MVSKAKSRKRKLMMGLGVTGAVVGTAVTAGLGGLVIGGVAGALGGRAIGKKSVNS
jgi:uncharacterized membrane protein